jgi:hypothetical protein
MFLQFAGRPILPRGNLGALGEATWRDRIPERRFDGGHWAIEDNPIACRWTHYPVETVADRLWVER